MHRGDARLPVRAGNAPAESLHVVEAATRRQVRITQPLAGGILAVDCLILHRQHEKALGKLILNHRLICSGNGKDITNGLLGFSNASSVWMSSVGKSPV